MFEDDQAAGLRQLFTRSRPEVILACGGATEQARIVAELGLGLAAQSDDILIIDGSAGEVAQILGVTARYELGHVVAGDKKLSEVLVKGAPDLRLLPAMRGLELLCRLEADAASRLRSQFARELATVETLIVNCRPLGSPVAARAFQGGAHVVVILSDHPESLTMAYREIKALRLDCGMGRCDVILSDAGARAQMQFASLADVSQRFLDVTLNLQGSLTQRGAARAEGAWAGARSAPGRTAQSASPIVRGFRGSPTPQLGYSPIACSRSADRESGRVRLNQEKAHAAIR